MHGPFLVFHVQHGPSSTNVVKGSSLADQARSDSQLTVIISSQSRGGRRHDQTATQATLSQLKIRGR